jgi:hypothetical protein
MTDSTAPAQSPPAAASMQQGARNNARANAPRPTPVWTCSIVLNTDFAQRVYKRSWDRLKADLYVLTVRTRSSGMDEAARAIEAMISEGFESARKDLTAELARSEALMDSVKLTDLPTYKGAQTIEAEYSTPRAKEFLNLLTQMDQLLVRYDALWLNAHIETQPRVQRSQNWQRRLIKVANRLRELGNRTRAGLTREAERRSGKGVAAAPAGEEGAAPARPSAEEVLDQLEDANTEPGEAGVSDAASDPAADLSEIEEAELAAAAVDDDSDGAVMADGEALETEAPAADAAPAPKRRRRAPLAAAG